MYRHHLIIKKDPPNCLAWFTFTTSTFDRLGRKQIKARIALMERLDRKYHRRVQQVHTQIYKHPFLFLCVCVKAIFSHSRTPQPCWLSPPMPTAAQQLEGSIVVCDSSDRHGSSSAPRRERFVFVFFFGKKNILKRCTIGPTSNKWNRRIIDWLAGT